MLFPRAIRLDESDTQVYEYAAAPGEWAIPASFPFLDDDPGSLSGKRLQAFRSGFLGTESFGWCTLVEVAEISDDDYQQVIDRLAAHFVARYAAPGIAAALPLAIKEAGYAAGICEYPVHTLLAVERAYRDDGIVERMKVVQPPDPADHDAFKLWSVDDQ